MRIKVKDADKPTSTELGTDTEGSGQSELVQQVAGVQSFHETGATDQSDDTPSKPTHKARRDPTRGQSSTPMTELQFLLELLLNHQLKKLTKDLVVTRIKIVEQNLFTNHPTQLQVQQAIAQPASRTFDARGIQQAPSMLAKIQALETGVPVQANQTAVPLSAMVGQVARPRLGDPAAGGNRVKDREVITGTTGTGSTTRGPRKY